VILKNPRALLEELRRAALASKAKPSRELPAMSKKRAADAVVFGRDSVGYCRVARDVRSRVGVVQRAASTGQRQLHHQHHVRRVSPDTRKRASGDTGDMDQPRFSTSHGDLTGAFDSGVIAPNGGQWSWVASASGTTLTYQDMVGQSFQGTLEIQPITPTGQ